jgi:hypothetical protein
VKRIDRTMILRKALELKFKGKRLMGLPSTRWFSRYYKTRRRE